MEYYLSLLTTSIFIEKGLTGIVCPNGCGKSNIVEASGNELFDQRAEKAVYSASPLPVPSEIRLFNKMRSIRITFEP